MKNVWVVKTILERKSKFNLITCGEEHFVLVSLMCFRVPFIIQADFKGLSIVIQKRCCNTNNTCFVLYVWWIKQR